MLGLNKISSKLFFFTALFIFLYFSAPEKTNAFPEFDYDGKADYSVFRPSNSIWHTYSTESQSYAGFQWGLASDVLVPADYDGDGLTDFAVWRPDDGVWYILQSSDGYNPRFAKSYQWGKFGDIPVQADYDGDKKADIAVFRGLSNGSAENRWYILQSSDNQWRAVSFGQRGDDLLVPADYDGDRKADIAVYRNGVWYILRSTDNRIEAEQFGLRSDKPVPADYDGDGKTDLAVYRNGTWFSLDSSTRRLRTFYYGLSSDIPLPLTLVKESIAIVS